MRTQEAGTRSRNKRVDGIQDENIVKTKREKDDTATNTMRFENIISNQDNPYQEIKVLEQVWSFKFNQ